MLRAVKSFLKSLGAKLFHAGQYLGWDLLPRHFYSEVPDIRKLKRTTNWRLPYTLHGVRGADTTEQLAMLGRWIPAELSSRFASLQIHRTACEANGEAGYGPVEAECLWAYIQANKPQRVIQVGCGVSTAVMLAAAADCGNAIAITCIEPYPTAYLQSLARDNRITLIAKPVEDVGTGLLATLEAGDLFFVDSTHALGPAGEVSRLVLEWLPRLPAEVGAHFHDIYFPYDYTANVLDGLFFPHESVLLQAYLANNACCRIEVALSMLHHAETAGLAQHFPAYKPAPFDHGVQKAPGHFPSAIYLRTS